MFFGIFIIFGKKNQRETVPEGATRQGACPRGAGVPQGGRRAPDPRGHPVSWLTLYFCRKKANIRKQIVLKVSIQSELRISRNIRNGKRAESGNAETERDRETDPISEGLSPLPCHGGHGPEGKPFSHLGRRSRKKKKEGGSLPLASGGTGVPPGAIIITAIYTNTSAIFTNISITFPLYLQRSTLPHPSIPST